LLSVLKLVFDKLYDYNIDFREIERPRKSRRLPVVLSRKEVRDIIANTSNLKHKAILATLYSLGLRKSEVIGLRIGDIDSGRMMVHIRGGKGNKDRYLGLPEKLLGLLKDYYRRYKPKDYLFEGQGRPGYSARSVDMIFIHAVERADIRKHVTVHTLRHSFATHLVESGVDIAYVQRLLGHESVKTTMIYMHIARKKLTDIRSPFDNF